MLPRLRLAVTSIIAALGLSGAAACAAEQVLKVGVLDSSPPMSYRMADGQLTGFSIEIARALCDEMRVRCDFQVTTIERVVDSVASGEFDIGAVSLLDTPERRARILLAQPHFRSISLWFAKPGVMPGERGLRVAVVKGSAQEAYVRKQGWDMVAVPTNRELGLPLIAGVAQAAIVPMTTSLNLMNDQEFRNLGLSSTVMKVPELLGNASFGINPRRPELKESVDNALEHIKRNGTYDRINSQFLPFRIQ